MNDLLINQVYAQSNSIYLPYISNNSDRRLKKNISKIPNALGKIQKLNGVYFEWKNMNKESNKEIGLIAQDVQTVIPEVVRKNSETGFFTVKYAQLTALLIEGMKEQQEQITELKKRIKKLT
ncbi:MAG: tail fiber domain-containing protein [Candidatus Roizmanbacteria bacterium]|nr:tail fiber domain-containing protein [Candidatus Roizmanbacteria bacterium]